MGFPDSCGCRVIVYKGGFWFGKIVKFLIGCFLIIYLLQKIINNRKLGRAFAHKLDFQAVSGPA